MVNQSKKGLWLLIDTAYPRAVVGLACDGQLLAEEYLEEPLAHSRLLPGAIDACFAKAGESPESLVGVAVGQGPGSFVGMRVAIAHAKGYCMARHISLIGVPTLDAFGAHSQLPIGDGLVATDAKRREIFVQNVRRIKDANGIHVVALDSVRAVTPSEATQMCQGASFVVGNGVGSLGEHGAETFELPGPSAQGMLTVLQQRLGRDLVDETHSILPIYGRAPDAKTGAWSRGTGVREQSSQA